MTEFIDNTDGIARTGHEYFMKMALAQAREAQDENEVPVGAVLVDAKGTVLARAHNRVIALADPSAHAEILALRQGAAFIGNYRLPKTILYVTIEPCIMCMGAAVHARVAGIVYGTEDPKWGGAGSLYDLAADARLNHHIAVTAGVLRDPCRRLIQNFFRKRRKALQASPT